MGCVESADNKRDAKRDREGTAMHDIDQRRNGPGAMGDNQRRQGDHEQKKPGSRQTKVLAKGVDIAIQTEQTAGLLLRRVSSRLKQRRKKSLDPLDRSLLFDLNRSVALSHSGVSQYIERALAMHGEQNGPISAEYGLKTTVPNGSIVSSFEGPSSDRDKKLLRRCWKEIQKDLMEFGVDLFVRLLEANPSLRELFPFGKLNLSPEKLRHNEDLRAHGLRVMETIGTAIDGLNEWDLIVPILQDLAARHKVYGTTSEHFLPLQEAFMYSLGNGLPPKLFNSEVQEAWLNLWKAIAAVMSETMRERRGIIEKQDEGEISARDKRLVQGSWKTVEKDLVNLGAALFVRFLGQNPSIKYLFPFGKLNLSPENLKDNPDLRAHGKNVMETIGTAVHQLDNPGNLAPLLEDLGARHVAYGAKPEHFKPLAEALIFTLKNGLPPKLFTAEVQRAWENVLKLVTEPMSTAMRSDEPDAVPLSERDKRLVRECWKVIQKDMINLGSDLFVRLLEKNPPIQNLFAFGKLNLPAEKLKQNKDLRSHGQRVMNTIGAVVLGLDDPDIIATILEDLGTRHTMYGTKPEHFPALVEAFMHSLKNGLPPKVFTSEVQEAWQNLMKLVAAAMCKTMRGDSGEDEGPISAVDKRLVQASWKVMSKDAVNLGAVLFARLLEKNPSIQKLFPFGKLNLSPDKLRQNPDLRAHGKGVMETIGMLVASLENLENIVPTLKELGARHIIYGAKPEHFPALVEAFVYSMKTQVLAEVFTGEVQEAWRNVLKVVDVTMSITMRSQSNGLPDVPLTTADKQLARGSWKFIQKDLDNLGANMFVRLLEKNPCIRKTFSFGKLNLSPDKLRQNPDLRAHAKGVMETIGSLVSLADDLERIIPMMEDLGARHRTYGAKPEHFPAIVDAFMYSLEKGLSPKVFTPDVQEAWRKILNVVSVTMGSTMSSDEDSVPVEDTTASPISPEDKQLVQRSWKFVQKDLVNLGAVMFVRLLEKNPPVANLFTFGKLNLPPDKLKQNPDLRAHGKGVMETIGTAVAALEDFGNIEGKIEDLGARHKIYGAKPEHFLAVVEALMYSLKQGLSPKVFTPETQEAWRKVLSVVGVTMSREMRLDENGNSEEMLISLKDKRLAQRSWKVMQKDLVDLGAVLFARLLDMNPSIRELFPFGKSPVPPQMLKHNSDLRAHGKGVMETIGTVVASLDDVGKIVPILTDLGTRHKVYGAKPEHFQPLMEAFMYTMKNSLSSKEFTTEVEAAWENIWKLVAEVMSDSME